MENIKINIKANDPNAVHLDDLNEHGAHGYKQLDANQHLPPDKKAVDDLWTTNDYIDEHIKMLKDKTS